MHTYTRLVLKQIASFDYMVQRTSKENRRMLFSVCITAFAFDSVLCRPLWRSNAIEMAHICIKSTCTALELNFCWASVLYFVPNVAVITKPALCSSFIVRHASNFSLCSFSESCAICFVDLPCSRKVWCQSFDSTIGTNLLLICKDAFSYLGSN